MNMSNNLFLNRVENKSAYQFEHEAWRRNELIFGIDEVGRGSFAGPVVACCLVLNPFVHHELLVDSKILSENNILKAASWIEQNSCYSIGIINNNLIDKLNIYHATILAMKRAFYGLIIHPKLNQLPSLTLIDAVPLALGAYKTLSFTQGESKSISVAAASIVAKKYRDELMRGAIDSYFPGYAFENNKGYGTSEHQEGLNNKGNSLVHRKTFIPINDMVENSLNKNVSIFT